MEQPAAGRDSSGNEQANEWSRHFHVLRAALCSTRAARLCLYVSIIVGKILNPRDTFKLERKDYVEKKGPLFFLSIDQVLDIDLYEHRSGSGSADW